MSENTSRLSTALADRYRIERELGAGGMATVYLAHDLKHDRQVAVKVLRPELAAVLGAERFVQEIKTTAALQHPHILPLFDSGTADGFLYYVMPFIDGETLRDKLNRETQFGIEEAVRITTDVADALDYAHRNNVIHRDIKPENILMHDGRPMVADFGIALAVSAAAGGRMTETGLSLGTPHYMSPEQATAEKDLTNRSDVYSLGCVLYEMITGSPPHVGSSAQQIIMKIVTEEAAPVTKVRKSVPPHVAAAVAKALEKLPADRFDSAASFAAALANPAFTVPSMAGTAQPLSHSTARHWKLIALAVSALAAVLLITTLAGWLRHAPQPVTRTAVTLPGLNLAAAGALASGAAVAPDGSAIVYSDTTGGTSHLVLKPRDRADAAPLAGTEGGSGPFFSPDGGWIGFFADGKLRKVPVGGGGALTLADSAADNTISGAWADDGSILFVDRTFSLRSVSNAGGASRELVHGSVSTETDLPDPLRVVVQVSALPGGRGALFTACNLQCSESAVLVYDAANDTIRTLFEEAAGVWYVPTGYVVYVGADGGAFAARFDLGSLAVSGAAVPVLEGTRAGDIVFGRDGTLLYVVGTGGLIQFGGRAEVVWVDRSGVATPVGGAAFELPAVPSVAISPDGSRLATVVHAGGADNVWIKQLQSAERPLQRVTFGPEGQIVPRWSPDGRSLTFAGLADGDVYSVDAEGLGAPTKLLDIEDPITASRWSFDGQWLLARAGRGSNNIRDIWALRPAVDSTATLLFDEGFDEISPAVSPDGRWLAYASNATGRFEVYVRPFPDAGSGKWQVSANGGREPLWAHRGHELFYIDGADRMVSATYNAVGGTFRPGGQTALFSLSRDYVTGTASNITAYDVSPDDRRFVFLRRTGESADQGSAQLIMVQNWFHELKRLVK